MVGYGADPNDCCRLAREHADVCLAGLATYHAPRQAAQSQYWMLVVMVAFTSLGLWLLSAVNT